MSLYTIFMLQKVLQSILRRYFGQFITGLQNVELTFWTGKIHIQNASFKHQRINQLLRMHNIPLSIGYSFIGSLELDVPWNKLSSAPVEIKLSDVYLVFSLEQFREESVQKLDENGKYLLIKNYVEFIMKKSEEMKGGGQSGFMKKLLVKVLHNVNLQVSNIHIRVETGRSQGQLEGEDMYYSCIGQDNKPTDFSLGFCIQSIQADTINQNNKKEYIQIESDKTPIRKNINLRQISFYWEEESVGNILSYPNDRKGTMMKNMVQREVYRLLTIDGTLLMQKNKHNLEYFFSTSLRVLEIKSNYQQMKQIIQVAQAFINAKKKKKLSKSKELRIQRQLRLEKEFKQQFQKLYMNKFIQVDENFIVLIDSVNRKLLMKWTRTATIDLMKRQKLKVVMQTKNKQSWLGYLSRSAQIALTEQQIRMVEQEIENFILLVENSDNLSAGLQVFINSIMIMVDHPKAKQKLIFIADSIALNVQKWEKVLKIGMSILDVGLTYRDGKKRSEVSIFKKNGIEDIKLVQLQLMNTPQEQKLQFDMESISITHEVQFLGFISQMINLQQKQQVKSNVMFINAEAINTKQDQSPTLLPLIAQKVYSYRVAVKKMEMRIELDDHTLIHAAIQGIKITRSSNQKNHHSANLLNFGIAYINTQTPSKSYNIIDNINIVVDLGDLKMVKSQIPKIRVVLNEESLYAIGSCLKEQLRQLKIRKKEFRAQWESEEERLKEGQTEIISLFKSMKVYHTVLVSDRLLFYQKGGDQRIDFAQVSRSILLQNLAITRVDDLSFKLESMTTDEIIYCKTKEDTDTWIYHIQQRIYESSSRERLFTMVEEGQVLNNQPHIYIPYDSTLDIKLGLLEVIYQKNSEERIMSVTLTRLNMVLKENNLQFERRIYLQEICIKNLQINDQRDDYNTLVSNMLNYFQDIGSDEDERQNISVVIEGKKKSHPKYTGEIAIIGNINRLFVNYNAEFVYNILYRLKYGGDKAKAYPQPIRNAKIIEILKQLLEQRMDIVKKYQNAQPFEFNKSYIELQKYRQLFSCHVLFHVQLKVDQAEVNLVNGRTNMWGHKALVDRACLQIDKGTDFIFIKAQASGINIGDITGYPKTNDQPFTQQPIYPLVIVEPEQRGPSVEIKVGLFPPFTFVNKQHFKNYFSLSASNLHVNYQQQPLMRFIDFLTNQVILFFIQPFSLHKYDSPQRGSYAFNHLNFTQPQIRKILYQSIYATYTHLRLQAHNMSANFNTHPGLECLKVRIKTVKLISAPYINNQRVHVRLNLLKAFEKDYATLQEIRDQGNHFDQRVSKCQWATRYLISAQQMQCNVIENQFNYQMYFERANNGDKDLLLPFLVIDKQLLMQARIKHLNLKAQREVYLLINRCFNFNLGCDDKLDMLYNCNHQFQSLNPPNKLIYSVKLNQLNYQIPQIKKTVIVIPDCQYRFIREVNLVKIMEITGKALHVFGSSQQNKMFRPLNFSDKNGLEYKLVMHTSGEKQMTSTITNIEFMYDQEYFMELLRYFLVDDSCYPRQERYDDVPLIRCEVKFKNSFYRIAENQEYVFALKGDIEVVWTRPKNIHPQRYKINKELYPVNSAGQIYDVAMQGVSFRKYSKKMFKDREKNYRALSLPMHLKLRLINVMKRSGQNVYTDMVGQYNLQFVCLKLCYKDIMQLQGCFTKNDQNNPPPPPQLQLGYVPQSKHNFKITKLSIELGLSELPVPLLSLIFQSSQIKLQIMGATKIITCKLKPTIEYWNMLIGRWQPVLQRSLIDQLTLRLGKDTYCSFSSTKALLLNFSTEAIKIIKLLSKDISQKGQTKSFSRAGRIQGMHVSPYALTNRTGHCIFLQNKQLDEFNQIEANKLKNNDTTHVFNKTPDLNEMVDTVKFQIEGDATEHEVGFNLVQTEKRMISYQGRQHALLLQIISSPILKEIVISSYYVIHNKTMFQLALSVEQTQFRVDPDRKVAIPFTMNMRNQTIMSLTFPHLTSITNNFNFCLLDIQHGYQHSIIYQQSQIFACTVDVKKSNQQAITVSPMTTFVNLLPLDLNVEIIYFKSNGHKDIIKTVLEVSQEKNLYQFGSKNSVALRINFIGFNYTAFHDLDFSRGDHEGKMVFIDHRGLQSYVLTKTVTINMQKTIYLYLQTVMINETRYPLFIYSKGQLLAGQRIINIEESQSKFTIINNGKDLSVGFGQQEETKSVKLNRHQLGNQFLKIPKGEHLHQIMVYSSVHCVNQKLQLFTKIMKIYPRYIIQNKCTRDLCLRQVNTDQWSVLKVGEINDWVWVSKDDSRQLTITAIDNDVAQDAWDFSSPIEPETLEQTVLTIRPNGRSSQKILIKIELFREMNYTYLVFRELADPQDSLLTFKNKITFINIQIYQSFLENISPPWHPYKEFNCSPMSETMFGWDYPSQDHLICVQFTFLKEYEVKYENDMVQLDMDKLNKPVVIQFRGREGEILQVEVSVEYIGMRKLIVFNSLDQSSTSQQYEEELQQELSTSKIGLSLSEIGISLIGGRPRSQILYTSIKKLELIIIQKLNKRSYELKIKYINIDNNLHHNTMYPVLFTPLKQRKTMQKPRPFLICLVEQNLKSTQITEFNYFRMAIQPISFKLYDEIVTKIYDMMGEFKQEQNIITDLLNTYRSYGNELEWREKEPSAKDKSIFIREIQIGKLVVELSFSIKPTSGGNIVIYTILTLFRTVLSNVSESQISLSRFYRKNISMPDLLNQFKQFAWKQVFKEIYKIPGSINILGNPYVLVKYLAEGVWEIVNQPSEGFIKGPIEGTLGVFKGGIYFTRNVIAGTFNSLQVMSQSISYGISNITFDQKFISRREKIQMQKSKHIGQGSKSALFALYTGFQVAITGLYRHPKEHMEESGATGFVKGVLIGLTGLVTKPIGGLFQGISKFSQGIKQTALFFQDGPNTTRSRPPRVFIGHQEYFTDYNLDQSKAINLLQFHSTKYLNSTVMFASVDLDPLLNEVLYSVLTANVFVIMSKTDKKILHEISVNQINEVHIVRSKEVKITIGSDSVLVHTHKYKQLIDCFSSVFDMLERNSVDQS